MKIVLTTYTGDAQVVRAPKAGARGYLLKADVNDELLDTICSVHAGKRWIHLMAGPVIGSAIEETAGRAV